MEHEDSQAAVPATMNGGEGALLVSATELYSDAGLRRIDARFFTYLTQRDPALAAQMQAAREAGLERKDESALWLAVAPHLDDFLIEWFDVRAEVNALRARQDAAEVIFRARRQFVQRHLQRTVKPAEAEQLDGDAALADLQIHLGKDFQEIDCARAMLDWLSREPEHRDALSAAVRFAAWASMTGAGRARFAHWTLFQVAAKRDPLARVPVQSSSEQKLAWLRLPAHHAVRERDGFALTDSGASLTKAMSEIHYCIYCHNQAKDSCSTGFGSPEHGFRRNAIGALQTGCPLGERISEMHQARERGHLIAALAVACVDNPMIAGTGHRICNDCMVSCIYQNQNRDPVDIPQAETRILKDVLDLPWGFEIYSLLTRWNPLNFGRPLPRAATGRSVLIVGAGPAGYTLAHHLLNDGHGVVLIDGLKIEPLAAGLAGRGATGEPTFALIRDVATLRESLDARPSAGFGGVAEYGITVRWDKNFLKMLRLLLERREELALHGGVRFGGTLTLENAFAAGFDHVALCTGAGRPTVLPIPNGLAPGVRQASDFLMALQLTGAARSDTVANLQIRLPILVVGGGLTAIDTCTEALAYYPVQVERFLSRYEELCSKSSEPQVRGEWTEQERDVADEFLAHARGLRAEREAARERGRKANPAPLLNAWGGARIVYRRKLTDSPAYRNHEEIAKALEEGIAFGENLTPLAVDVDRQGHACALRVRDATTGLETTLPARTILVAAGTVPNTVAARETAGLEVNGRHFQAVDESGRKVDPDSHCKPNDIHVLAHVAPDGRAVSFFGDLHPSYAGNVVKAMASAKNGYPVISRLLSKIEPQGTPRSLRHRLHEDLSAVVRSVRRLTRNVVEVVVQAPAAARAFRPGQFFRLQNFEAWAPVAGGTKLVMEGLALTGAWVDVEAGLVGLIALEVGGSSDLCQDLKVGEPVILMGPTGEPTAIPRGETVALIGGGLGNAVLFSIGMAMRAAGCRVLYFAGYRAHSDVFYRERIENAADSVIWCADHAPAPPAARPGDSSFVGNIVEALVAYATGGLGETSIALRDVDRIIAIGSDGMMAAVAAARHAELSPYLKPGHVALASINSPMQCMMKEICAQCLQTHRDRLTGEESVVFTCLNQDQPMDRVVFADLRGRLRQNSLQEKLTSRWIRACRAAEPGTQPL
jgi:NADPH-dependent glutamate synthase beta subunit-like oxidoreductase/NAD(P)H-flavin reductase